MRVPRTISKITALVAVLTTSYAAQAQYTTKTIGADDDRIDQPWFVRVNPVTNRIYAVNNGGSFSLHGQWHMAVIDGATDAIIDDVGTGGFTRDIVINEVTNKIYWSFGSEMAVLDGQTGAASGISNSHDPAGMAINRVAVNTATNTIYGLSESGNLAVIDGATDFRRRVLQVLPPSQGTIFPLVVDQDLGIVYAVGTNQVAVIHEAPGVPPTVQSVSTSRVCTVLAVLNPVTHHVYLVDACPPRRLMVFDGSAANTVLLGDVFDVAVDPGADKIYALVSGAPTRVMVLDGATDTVIGAVEIADSAFKMKLDAGSNRLFVIHAGLKFDDPGSATVIDTSNGAIIQSGIPIGISSNDVAVNRVSHKAYVANLGTKEPGLPVTLDEITVIVPPDVPNTPVSQTPIAVGVSAAVNVTFSSVTAAGTTTAVPIDPAAAGALPGGFILGPGLPAYEIATTAQYTAPVTVCLTIDPPVDPVIYGSSQILHSEGGSLVAKATTRNPSPPPQMLCADVDSLSPFVAAMKANRPPVADAGPDRTVACTSAAATPVVLDGSRSSDPDGDPLSFLWTGPFPGTLFGVNPTVSLALGTHTITLTVSDDVGGATDAAPSPRKPSSDAVNISVVAGVAGLQAPLGALVPAGTPVPFPGTAFKQGRTLPLGLRLFCGSAVLGDTDVAPPRIVGLVRNGDAMDLATLDLDAGASNDDGTQFRYSAPSWMYNLSTRGLTSGSYVITLEMPDSRRFNAGFMLR